MIVEENRGVTLVGGGLLENATLEQALALAPYLVAADGGADRALVAGHVPDMVIGDMDSITDHAKSVVPVERVHRVADQDSTDFDKAVRNIDAPMVLAVGFTGGRSDHFLAVLHSLLVRGASNCLVLDQDQVMFLAPPDISMDLARDSLVSVYPLCPVGARSTGLYWPLDEVDLGPGRQIGTSNRATGPVRIITDGPGLLIILPAQALPQAVAGLGACGAIPGA